MQPNVKCLLVSISIVLRDFEIVRNATVRQFSLRRNEAQLVRSPRPAGTLPSGAVVIFIIITQRVGTCYMPFLGELKHQLLLV